MFQAGCDGEGDGGILIDIGILTETAEMLADSNEVDGEAEIDIEIGVEIDPENAVGDGETIDGDGDMSEIEGETLTDRLRDREAEADKIEALIEALSDMLGLATD